jgi:hypothetical protein
MANTERRPLMAVRLLFTDDMGEEIEPRLASMSNEAGSPPELSEQCNPHRHHLVRLTRAPRGRLDAFLLID